jgi:hypothetical protein
MTAASRFGRGQHILPTVLFLGLMLLAAVPGARAADVVELRFQSAAPDTSLEDLLYLAIGVELSQAGLSSSRAAGTGTYLLTANYMAADTSVHLSLRLSKSGASEPLAQEEADVPVDDTFETQVGQAVRKLVAAGFGQNRSNANADATIGGLLPPKPAANGPRPTTLAWRADAVFGGTRVFGDLSALAQGGYEAAMSTGMFWLAETWSLKVAVRAGTIRLYDNTGVSGGPLYLSSAALGADWGTGRQLPFRLLVGGSIGALVLSVAKDQVKSKTVPWADGDAGLEFPVGAGFSLGAELRLQAAYEHFLIWGISPGLTVGKEF